MKTRTNSALASLALAVVAVASPALAQDGAEDPTVATINGEEVLRSEVLELAENLPPQYREQLATVFPQLLEQVIRLRLVASVATEAGLAEDPEVRERLEARRIDIMRNVYLERALAERVTDDLVKERYETLIAENPPAPEIRARHILVETEESARDLIGRLDGGADFAELAQEHSTGPSSAQGGDLGYFADGQMVPAFSEAAFALEAGAHTAAPVQTEFGWHVIKVEDRRTTEPPAFEDVRDQLRADAERDVVQDILRGLRDSAEVELVTASEEEPAAESGETADGERSN